MSSDESGYGWRRATFVCAVLAVLLAAWGVAPTLECVAGFPANAPDLVGLGVVEPGQISPGASTGEGYGLCREAYPLSNQSGSLVMSLVFGLFALVSWSMGRASTEDEEEWEPARPVKPLIEEAPRVSVPDVIELDEEIDLGLGGKVEDHPDDVNTLMDQVSTQQRTLAMRKIERERVSGGRTPEGFFVPEGYDDASIIYVDASSFEASDDMEDLEGRVGAPERPFETIGAAMEVARELSGLNGRVQVRVVPGVYQEAVSVPARVVLVNNRMPASWPAREYITWLKDQVDVDHPERVTLLAPFEDQVCVEIEPGGLAQGLYGLHLVGREETQQRGVSGRRGMATTLMACSIQGYVANGVRLDFCGREEPGLRTQIVACMFKENRAIEGGGLALADGVYDVSNCLFEGNRARNGGAIHGVRLKSALMIEGCEFTENSAQTRELPGEPPRRVLPMKWKEIEGLGGAVYMLESVCKMQGCRFTRCGASYAGGAVAVLGSKVIVDGGEDQAEIKEMKSRTGGAVFASGWPAAPAMLKVVRTTLRKNESIERGGAVAVVGVVRAQLEESSFELNTCSGEEGEGGAVSLSRGAEVVLVRALLRANRSTLHGGAVSSSDASLSVREGTVFQDNVAEGGAAGAVFFDAEPLMGEPAASRKPSALKLASCEFVGNIASKGCSVVFAGSMMTGPAGQVRVSSGEGVEMRANRLGGKGRENNNVLFVWDGNPEHRGEGLPDGLTVLG